MEVSFGTIKMIRPDAQEARGRFGFIVSRGRELFCHMDRLCGFRWNTAGEIVFEPQIAASRQPMRGDEVVFISDGPKATRWGLKRDFVKFRDGTPPQQLAAPPSQPRPKPSARPNNSYGGGTELY